MNSFPHQVWSTLVRLAAGFGTQLAEVAPTSTSLFTVNFDGVEQLPPMERELESVFHSGLLKNMHQMGLNRSRSDRQRSAISLFLSPRQRCSMMSLSRRVIRGSLTRSSFPESRDSSDRSSHISPFATRLRQSSICDTGADLRKTPTAPIWRQRTVSFAASSVSGQRTIFEAGAMESSFGIIFGKVRPLPAPPIKMMSGRKFSNFRKCIQNFAGMTAKVKKLTGGGNSDEPFHHIGFASQR